VPKTLHRRAHVVLPVDLVAEIDKLVGKRGRSAFLTEVARREVMIRRQREALRNAAGAWKDEDHPELANGAAEWVRQLRAQDMVRENERLEQLERSRDGK
jgi:hypothetical protein